MVEAVKRIDCDFVESLVFRAWCDNINSVLENFMDLEDRILGLHAPKATSNLASSSKMAKAEAKRLLECSLRMASDLGAENLTVHLWEALSPDPLSADQIVKQCLSS